MLRIFCRDVDIGVAANIGGPVNNEYRTFDISAPELEAWLSKKQEWHTREAFGIELLIAAERQPVEGRG